MNFQRQLFLKEGYDLRDKKPDGGVGSSDLILLLKSEEQNKAVHFVVYTNRYLPHVQEEFCQKFCYPDDYETILSFTKNPFKDKNQILKELHLFNKICMNMPKSDFVLLRPKGLEMGYHSPTPIYKNQAPRRKVVAIPKVNRSEDGELEFTDGVYGEPIICDYLNTICYTDSSCLIADEIFKRFLENGDEEFIWDKMTDYYHQIFD